jgi:small multidrug resistance pump
MSVHHGALIAAIVAGIGGQLLLKAGAVNATELSTQLMRLPTIAGLACYFASALCYLVALQGIPVSIAFPSVAVSYVAISVLGAVLWSEPFGVSQAAGLVLICAGVVLLHRG